MSIYDKIDWTAHRFRPALRCHAQALVFANDDLYGENSQGVTVQCTNNRYGTSAYCYREQHQFSIVSEPRW